MDAFIENAATSLGISEENARAATAELLGHLAQHGRPADVDALRQRVPGAKRLIREEGQADPVPGIQGLTGQVGDTLGAGGEDMGGALGVVDALSRAGVPAGAAKRFLALFRSHVEPLAGREVLERLFQRIPGIGNLLD